MLTGRSRRASPGVRRAVLELPCIRRGFVSRGSPRSSRPSPMPDGSPSQGSWLSTPGCGTSPETARSNPFASALTSAPSAASSWRSCPCGSARPTPPSWRASWRCQKSSRCAPLPRRRQHPHAGGREKHPRPAPDHRVDPRRRRRRPQQHGHLPGRGHPLLAARPAPLRVAAGSWRRPERSQPGALPIASANDATAISSFSIASRPGGLAMSCGNPMPGESGPAPAGAHKAPEIGKQLEKT